MGYKNKRRTDYAALFHAIAGQLKPLLQNEEFRKDMLRGTIGMIAFVTLAIFALSLNTSGKKLQKFMDEIEPPPGAVLVRAAGFREGQSFYYKFLGMSDEEIRTYYKKELAKRKWVYMKHKKISMEIVFFTMAK